MHAIAGTKDRNPITHAVARRKDPSEQIPPTRNTMNRERMRLSPSIRLAPHSIIMLRLLPAALVASTTTVHRPIPLRMLDRMFQLWRTICLSLHHYHRRNLHRRRHRIRNL